MATENTSEFVIRIFAGMQSTGEAFLGLSSNLFGGDLSKFKFVRKHHSVFDFANTWMSFVFLRISAESKTASSLNSFKKLIKG